MSIPGVTSDGGGFESPSEWRFWSSGHPNFLRSFGTPSNVTILVPSPNHRASAAPWSLRACHAAGSALARPEALSRQLSGAKSVD